MTPAVLEKFNEGKKFFESGREEFLPLLKALQVAEDGTAKSKEYKELAKAIEVAKDGGNATELNKDGLVKGKSLNEKEYAQYLARQKQK